MRGARHNGFVADRIFVVQKLYIASWSGVGRMAVLEVPDEESFERDVLRADGPIVVAFWAEWCPHCRRFRPLFESASDARGERFAIVRLDADDNPLWDRYAVAVVPTVALFRDGRLAARRDGVLGRGIGARDLAAFLHEFSPPATTA